MGFFWDLLVLYFALFGFIEGPRITRDLSIFMYLFIELFFNFGGGGSSVEKLMIFCLQCVVLYYGGVTRSDREQLLLTFLLYL